MSLLISVIWILIMSGRNITIKNEIMIKRLYLYYSVLILTFSSSSCNRDVAISNIVEQEENVEVSFFVDSKAIDVDVETDMVPMARTVTTNYNDFCYALGYHIIMKKSPDNLGSYYVVSVTDIACVRRSDGDKPMLPANIRLDDYDLKITPVVLQPGEYKSMVVLNAFLGINGPMNGNTYGSFVEEDTNIIGNLFNRPRSIYVGTIEKFTVTKGGVLTDETGNSQSLTYENIERYTTPINIILSNYDSDFRDCTLYGEFEYDFPEYLNYNGKLVNNNTVHTIEDFKVSYDITAGNKEWRFAGYDAKLEPDYTTIYPLIYTINNKESITTVNLTINQIYYGVTKIYDGEIKISDIGIEHGKPFNILLDFSAGNNPQVITDQDEINQQWKETNANDDYIPLNYVEYNPDRYE